MYGLETLCGLPHVHRVFLQVLNNTIVCNEQRKYPHSDCNTELDVFAFCLSIGHLNILECSSISYRTVSPNAMNKYISVDFLL